MNIAVAIINLATGTVYLLLACQALWEIARERRSRGISRFGLAYVGMALSCGPHHLIHGIQAIEGEDFNWMMLTSDLLALVPAVVFVSLRIEAMLGRRGDRFVVGTPWWLRTMAAFFWCACGGLVAQSIAQVVSGHHHPSFMAIFPNALVLVTYGMVGVLLFRTQLLRNPTTGGWSVSGLSLAAIFPSCALTHVVYGLTASFNLAICPADWFGIPASIYFLWIVHRLYTAAIVDWNRRPIVGESRRTERISPWARDFLGERPARLLDPGVAR
jgi:hypothetical protein